MEKLARKLRAPSVVVDVNGVSRRLTTNKSTHGLSNYPQLPPITTSFTQLLKHDHLQHLQKKTHFVIFSENMAQSPKSSTAVPRAENASPGTCLLPPPLVTC